MLRTQIIGTGSYIPPIVKRNEDFLAADFFGIDRQKLATPIEDIVTKFKEITGIEERRYARVDQNASDLGYLAAVKAIEDANIDPNTLDQIIFAHNFGDVKFGSFQTDATPSLAARVKNKLGITNNNCTAYDILFGCPGWLQGVIHADAFFKAGIAKRILVIGAETLSRVVDTSDRDSMIFADGAGATVLEYSNENSTSGILSTGSQSYCVEQVDYISAGTAYQPNEKPDTIYIKMKGRKVYEFALKNVPIAMKETLEKANLHIDDVAKIFIHQANEKMDDAIGKMLYRLYGVKEVPNNMMPMNIHHFGNSSVATIPTLLDMVRKNELPEHKLEDGNVILFASVGAGMHINCVCYRV